ncbi:MBL fold metallo-hydrolase [Celerinatantimonas sp. YJH-8]|uniref:MBL fold metallo-hydrolase n=1 Tax=Celerinatantimonas sp. YJH-8 TaxID=3228714 RepID=UPI0038BF85CC
MELKVLVDNNTIIDRYYVGEPGVCYLIHDGERHILFDVGYSDVFMQNAHKMGEPLIDIDHVVLSHGHNDHTGGLIPLLRFYSEAAAEGRSLTRPTLMAHPEAFAYKADAEDEIGSVLSAARLSRHFKLALSREPQWLTERLVFLGEIPKLNTFENQVPVGMCGHAETGEMVADFVRDDSALAYKSAQGLVVITGCSHAGICNIIEYAKQVCEDTRIVDVIGGFHLLDPEPGQLQQTLSYFEQLHVPCIHPCHCTDLKSRFALSEYVDVREVGVGLTLRYS